MLKVNQFIRCLYNAIKSVSPSIPQNVYKIENISYMS